MKIKEKILDFFMITIGTAIVDKSEYQKLMSFIRKTDPDVFVTVYAVNEMRYIPKEVNEKKATP